MPIDASEVISWGREVLLKESSALLQTAEKLDSHFVRALQLVLACSGKVVVTGLGKSGHVGQKIASTLASTGTPSFFLHPSEALHGDFGMMAANDILLAIAYRGETREVLSVCRFARQLGVQAILGVTGFRSSQLASSCDVVLDAWVEQEADSLGLAPTASSTVCLALGDALAVALMRARGFSREHFARLHPGGSLGRAFSRVGEVMQPKAGFASVEGSDDFHRVLLAVTSPNFGVVAVLAHDKVVGCISDGDLRRALLHHGKAALDLKASDLLNASPKTVSPELLVMEAVAIMEEHKITSLFVVDAQSKLLGIVRLHDILSAKIL